MISTKNKLKAISNQLSIIRNNENDAYKSQSQIEINEKIDSENIKRVNLLTVMKIKFNKNNMLEERKSNYELEKEKKFESNNIANIVQNTRKIKEQYFENKFPFIKNKRISSVSSEKNKCIANPRQIKNFERSISKEKLYRDEGKRSSNIELPLLKYSQNESHLKKQKKFGEQKSDILRDNLSKIIENPESQKINFTSNFSQFSKLFPNNYTISNIIDRLSSSESQLSNLSNHYTYVIMCKQDLSVIDKSMAYRTNWSKSTNKLNYNFKWKYSTKGIEYKNLSKSYKSKDKLKIVNHFEFHTEITDKRKMFNNLIQFCDLIELDIFKIIPFTIILTHRKDIFDHNYKSFSEIFNILNNMKESKIYKSNKEITYNENEIHYHKKYTDLFEIKEKKCNLNMEITLPLSFFANENLWIIKPGDLCQGRCMKISNDLNKLNKKIKKYFSGIDKTFKDSEDENQGNKIEIKQKQLLQESENNQNKKKKKKSNRYLSSSVILQKYLERPLLYMNRKFDIRIWVLIDFNLNVFVFKEGHLKCSSEEYNVKDKNQFVHITNYSVQKHSKYFGQHEIGNEVSFSSFQRFLDSNESGVIIERDIMPRIKKIIELTSFSVNRKLNRRDSRYCFELLGYDFIIDSNYDVWLLEVNDNPGLSESSPLIKILVPRMIDDALKLTIDKVFNTKYDESLFENGKLKSPYHVDGYNDFENMFEFLCNSNIDEEVLKKN